MKRTILITLFFIVLLTTSAFAIDISSENAILIDTTTGRTIFQQGAYAKAFPASTTKIMTAILTLENLELTDTLVASENAVKSVPSGGSICDIQAGEEFTVEQLLEGLLIASGNEAANILAEGISGTIEEFVVLMNKKSNELDLTLTHFVNSNGLHNENHYSCAYDLAKMYRYAYNKFPDFRRITGMKAFSLPPTSIHTFDDRSFNNSNKMIIESNKYYYEPCTGGKTGFTSEAKNCLVASASKDGIELIACVLGGGKTEEGESQRYLDTKALFEYGFSNLVVKTIAKSGDILDTIEVENSKNRSDRLNAVLSKPVTIAIEQKDLNKDFEPKITITRDMVAPISSGEYIGKATYNVYGTYYDVDLFSGNSVEVKPDFSAGDLVADILIIILRIIIVIVIIILILRFYNKVIRKNAKKSRSSRTRRYNARFRR